MTTTATPDTDTPDMPDTSPGAVCQNCGAPLLGPHCYRCGQPVTGLVRHFTSIVGDFLDTVLNIDARVFRTLWPLLAKPAYLSCEYFAGRRVRYVSPVRLFVFLSIVTFFVARMTLSVSGHPIQFGEDDAIASATSVAEVEKHRDEAITALTQGRKQGRAVPGLDAGLASAQEKVRHRADARIAEIKDAEARGQAPPKPKPDITFGEGKPWNAKTNPLVINWLPAFANHWINEQIAHAETNVARMQEDPSIFKDAVLGAIPSTLFVLLPVFALLLVFLTMALRDSLAPASGPLHGLLGLVEVLLFAWMPLYLLLMQKRVYRQGWIMTLIKYGVLGFSYILLLSFGAVFTVLASLVWA